MLTEPQLVYVALSFFLDNRRIVLSRIRRTMSLSSRWKQSLWCARRRHRKLRITLDILHWTEEIMLHYNARGLCFHSADNEKKSQWVSWIWKITYFARSQRGGMESGYLTHEGAKEFCVKLSLLCGCTFHKYFYHTMHSCILEVKENVKDKLRGWLRILYKKLVRAFLRELIHR